ncbi:hypothetical protein DPX16_2375 [Anabarilius grahami]|uniref:Uncharacterized protein n=1 Tax=Anabarilius grahami TaxID=495550 RepID=A0A3N0XSE7_ANAGA|nr:hypothetical protein DPX16_2375 [Anabarilius grahami]
MISYSVYDKQVIQSVSTLSSFAPWRPLVAGMRLSECEHRTDKHPLRTAAGSPDEITSTLNSGRNTRRDNIHSEQWQEHQTRRKAEQKGTEHEPTEQSDNERTNTETLNNSADKQQLRLIANQRSADKQQLQLIANQRSWVAQQPHVTVKTYTPTQTTEQESADLRTVT